MEDRLLYRVPEVALILNISRSKVYELFASGELESVLSAVANAQRDLQVSTGRALLEGTALAVVKGVNAGLRCWNCPL